MSEKHIFNVTLFETNNSPILCITYTTTFVNAIKHASKLYAIDRFDSVKVEKMATVTGKPIYQETSKSKDNE